MSIHQLLVSKTKEAFQSIYHCDLHENEITIQETKKDFEGDYTVVVFTLLKFSKQTPEETAQSLGNYLKDNTSEVVKFNIIKGFLNLKIANEYWYSFLNDILQNEMWWKIKSEKEQSVMVEFSSPNTNKPLHLGHLRNNFLGNAVSNILKANGINILKVNLVNDRGIHICKTMLAWKKWGNGETPEKSGKKGDHFVGDFYIRFEQAYKSEVDELLRSGQSKDEAMNNAPLIVEAKELLKKWEANDDGTRKIWKMMNDWVYNGFDKTYESMGIDFDKTYYESETYQLGKKIVWEGLANGLFFQKDDGSIWVDLSKDGMDEKLLLRSDGTAVYITQDIGTVQQRSSEYDLDKIVYVVGDEQNYHFNVLKLIMGKIIKGWNEKLHHLSYGMVDLPTGKMKSREGKVVDADELMQEMIETAEKHTKELGKIEGFSEEEATKLYQVIGLGALKYHLLKVDPKKRILFNPEESIDFHGHTGPFIQYTYARIQSVLRKFIADSGANKIPAIKFSKNYELHEIERTVLSLIHKFPDIVKEAGKEYSPALIANHVYELAKEYNKFYAELSILSAESEDIINFRVSVSFLAAQVIKNGMGILGIDVPDKM
ncbi:arginine--tRNA ligase [Candidatus Amoebophilus asiaticus]|nr:arginine--tRNA ligase [Candidatus Amoebophilus asiaticus]